MRVKRFLKWVVLAVPVVLLAAVGVGYVRSTNACADRAATTPRTPRTPIRAAELCEFGGPEAVKLTTIEKPVPAPGEVLVRVRASSVNPADWHAMRGEPYVARFSMGMRVPSETRIGTDFAGVVEGVGENVSQFKVGDEVFGGRTGAFADYVVVRASGAIVKKPTNVPFEEAGGVGIAAITALQALRDQGKLKAGERVLVNGASGGVGTFAVQIARALGAEVTGVSSTRNVELVTSLGADHVIDYTKEDFTRGGRHWDVIIDNVGNHPLSAMRRVLAPGGRYVMVGGQPGRWLAPLPRAFATVATSWFVDAELRFFIASFNQPDLQLIASLMEAGKVRTAVDRTYSLAELQEAIRYQEAGRARGKVVVKMD